MEKARKIVPPLIVVALVIVAAVQFRVQNQEAISSNNSVLMSDLSEQRKLAVDNSFFSDLATITSITETYGERLLDPDKRLENLKSIEEIGVFDYVRFVDPEGCNLSSSGNSIDCSDREYYTEGIKGNRGICSVLDSRQNAETMIGFYAPIVVDDVVRGVMVGFINEKNIEMLLSNEIYGYQLHAYLVSPKGIVLASSNSYSLGKSIYNYTEYGLALPLRNMLNSLVESESLEFESIHYVSNDVKNIAFVSKLESVDYFFVQTFPRDVQIHINDAMGTSGETLFLKLFGIFFVYVAYIVFDNISTSRRKDQEMKVVTLGLSNDNDFVFLLRFSDNSIRLVKDSRQIPYLFSDLKESNMLPKFLEKVAERYVVSADRKAFKEDSAKGYGIIHTDEDVFRHTARIIVEGSVIYMQYSYQKMKAEKDWYLVVSGRNVTDVAERELKEKKRLEKALDAAEKATKAKSTFLANMSHDIRTPMNAIVGFTNMAQTHIEDKEKVKESLGKIAVSSQHLLSLINDVLDMTRIEGGKIKLEETSSSFAEILNGLVSITQTEVAQRSLSFHVFTEDLVHEVAVYDKLRLNQVLLNCLSNAIKYTPEGGKVTLVIREKWDGFSDSSLYEFIVRDTGIGMAPEFLDHIFEPFERERNTTISGIQGTGLGMSISKNLIDLMGGRIEVKSEVGMGSEFRISLHFKHGDPLPIKNFDSFQGKRALVVGNTSACRSAASYLFRLGLEVTSVTTEQELLQKAKDADVFFVDHVFTDKFGLSIGTRILDTTESPTPVLIYAFYSLKDETKNLAKECGFQHFVMKPVFTSDFENIFSKYLDDSTVENMEKHFDLTGKRILVVEDNALNRDIAMFILSDAGMEVEFAEDGRLGFEMVRDHESDYYAMVLMDIQMPVMNGLDSSRAIRALEDKAKANIPIIAMTANAFEEDKKQSREAGMDAHIAKPIEIDHLLYTMSEIFQTKSRLSENK